MDRRIFVALAAVALAWWLVPLTALAQSGPDTSSTALRELSDFALWSLLLGPITSLVAATLNRTTWRSDVRFAVFFVFSLVAAAGNAYFNADLDAHDFLRSALLTVASGITFYTLSKGAIKTWEARTTPDPQP